MPDVLMPRLSDTMEEGVLSTWHKHEGDRVHRGDVLADIDTDKATMELEAYDDGVLSRILVDEGSTVSIGTPIAVIATPDAGTDRPPVEAPPALPDAQAEPARQPTPTPTAPAAERAYRASPLARRLAREHGIDIAGVPGSGPGGRIVRADIDAAIAAHATPPSTATPAQPPPVPTPAASPPPPAPHRPVGAADSAGSDIEEIPLSRVRRLTAQRLAASARQAPHFYLTRVVDATALTTFRTQVNTDLADTGVRVSVTDLLVKSCAQALIAHPEVNSSWAEDRLLRHHRIHIGIAVALDDGLIVPVIHDADRKTLSQISREARDLVERARSGRLSLDEITGGTFTISNLGSYGIDQFTAVINPPEAAILAVGAAAEAPIVHDGRLTVGTTMRLTLFIDHRVLDGAAGAVFLADLVALLQHPTRVVL